MSTENDVAILYITNRGHSLAEKLNRLYPGALVRRFKADLAGQLWHTKRVMIFIMAAGIVVRTIGPLVRDKKKDPAVIVLDEKGTYAVSLLSGHVGGANERAEEIARFLGGRAVITTASDMNNATAIDVWAKKKGLAIEDWGKLPAVSTRLLNRGTLKLYTDVPLEFPDDFVKADNRESADAVITNKADSTDKDRLVLRPKNLVVGIGCNKGTKAEEIEEAVKKTLAESGLSFLSVQSLATIDRKRDEPGLVHFAKKYALDIDTFIPEKLNEVIGIARSDAAFRATGAQAVAEPAALLASGADRILVAKQKIGNVTVAVAEVKSECGTKSKFGIRSAECGIKDSKYDSTTEPKPDELLTPHSPFPIPHSPFRIQDRGAIYIVGSGPGSLDHITPHALDAIRNSDIVVGYGPYLKLVDELLAGKEVISTGMTKEVERCRRAVELAVEGKTVSVVSGGDPGIFAMAGLVFEILKNYDRERALQVFVEVIPGISALNACAARLGAPLMHDFAAISLSDRLTPWDRIERRLEAAAMSDLVIVLYNPKSTGRQDQIQKTIDIMLKWRNPGTPVGIVRAAMRENEEVTVTNLGQTLSHPIDMQTTVIIGNSQTFVWNGRMITPRGYENKFKI